MAICAEGAKEKGGEGKRTTPGIPQTLVTIHSKINHRAWKDKGCERKIPSQAGYGSGNNGRREKNKRTTPGIPTWSPTVELTWPDSA